MLVIPLTGCNPTDAKELASDAEQLGRTASRSAVNATLAGKVNTALSLRKGVHMEYLHIEAEKGEVKVGGHVETQKEKDLIIEIVSETRGVDKVIDELRVEPNSK